MNWLQKQLITYTDKLTVKKQTLSPIGKIAAKEITEINRLFAQHGIDARVDANRIVASDTGNFIRYRIIGSSKISKIRSVEEDIEVALSSVRGEDVKLKLRTPSMVIELSYPLNTKPLEWDDAPLATLKEYQALLGVDYSKDTPISAIIDYTKKTTSNTLSSGTTGSGKTSVVVNAFLSMAFATSPSKALFICCDPKNEDLQALQYLPHALVFADPLECAAAIHSVKVELDRRKKDGNDSRKIFLLIDEFAELLASLSKEAAEILTEDLKSIARMGRSKNIHVVLITQKSLVDIVDSEAKGNFPIRIGCKTSTREESKVATGLDDIGCEYLPGAGSYYYINDGVNRIQGYYLPDDERQRVAISIADKWQDDEPFRIEIVGIDSIDQSVDGGKVPTNKPIEWYVERVVRHERFTEVFPPNGKPVKGHIGKTVELIFGNGTPNAGRANEIAGKVCREITKSSVVADVQSSTEESTV